MTNNQNIDKLLAKFYDASISQEEIDILFNYFLYTDPLPECYADDVDLIRGLAIMRYCHKTKTSFEKSLIEKERKIRNAFIYKKVKYGVAAAASVAILVLALWQVRTNSVLIPNTPEALQSSASVLVAQTTDTNIPNIQDHKPATITDNEIKNTIVQSADRHDEPILTAEQNIITDVPTQKNETANLLQKHNAIAENIDTPKPKIYCSNGCSDEYIMGLFDECVLA